jgi:hypothetical protein
MLAAIDQLLGYLTWRDSKACLVLFVRNRDFTAVLSTLKDAIQRHSEFGRFVGQHKDSWFEYRFHLPGDPEREIWLTVLAFHLADTSE